MRRRQAFAVKVEQQVLATPALVPDRLIEKKHTCGKCGRYIRKNLTMHERHCKGFA